jgi:hypothetical protein
MDGLLVQSFVLEEGGILTRPGLSELLDLGMDEVILLASRDDVLESLVKGDSMWPLR